MSLSIHQIHLHNCKPLDIGLTSYIVLSNLACLTHQISHWTFYQGILCYGNVRLINTFCMEMLCSWKCSIEIKSSHPICSALSLGKRTTLKSIFRPQITTLRPSVFPTGHNRGYAVRESTDARRVQLTCYWIQMNCNTGSALPPKW